MKTAAKRGSYPHPVLDASDDVSTEFQVLNAVVTPTVNDVEVKFQVRMTDPDIQALLDTGLARYSFRWTCSSTIAAGELGATVQQRHVDGATYVGSIDQEDVRRLVIVELRIVAIHAIPNHRLTNQNPEYGNATFSILPGDVLAEGGSFQFEPEKRYDPLMPPVGSCFRFESDPKRTKGIDVKFFDDEYVLVTFPERLQPHFAAAGPEIQIGLVVLPALMEAVNFIKANESSDSSEDLTEKSWYTALFKLISENGSLAHPTFELAQKMLGYPLDTALSAALDHMGDE
ncbi:hypothetical protein [Arthrobacter sp. zg-Y1171]|uniref:hypothetical protein n=1 Tax=Arthrobacter sp. zg-Y1171 TaxID=2964610 RepID=UPI002107F0F6|nr:hypothetical protein [Arthrobacter sp. zg-Y1171]MCQ1996863.1 hypothetical protein [Arthrobacter sp. zg-Y1171]UWX82451.1 hypothetical protein N2L00_03195 [Arthrobacter sp. zg-Y1171]